MSVKPSISSFLTFMLRKTRPSLVIVGVTFSSSSTSLNCTVGIAMSLPRLPRDRHVADFLALADDRLALVAGDDARVRNRLRRGLPPAAPTVRGRAGSRHSRIVKASEPAGLLTPKSTFRSRVTRSRSVPGIAGCPRDDRHCGRCIVSDRAEADRAAIAVACAADAEAWRPVRGRRFGRDHDARLDQHLVDRPVEHARSVR